jgi:hypothetical protein
MKYLAAPARYFIASGVGGHSYRQPASASLAVQFTLVLAPARSPPQQ